MVQLYPDRADVEFDDLTNNWRWGGFMTQELKRTPIVVRMNAPFCNWGSASARMIDSDARGEAKTSRPMMVDGAARFRGHGR